MTIAILISIKMTMAYINMRTRELKLNMYICPALTLITTKVILKCIPIETIPSMESIRMQMSQMNTIRSKTMRMTSTIYLVATRTRPDSILTKDQDLTRIMPMMMMMSMKTTMTMTKSMTRVTATKKSIILSYARINTKTAIAMITPTTTTALTSTVRGINRKP